MLNIGRMAPGSHDYYLSVVADGAEDYYLRRGEAPGRWLGRGLDGVGLDGRVEADQLRRVLAGDHPLTGERLASHPARKVPGFDLTFRAPKSVSLLWAFTDRDTASQVLAAHEAAVQAAIGYVEREAARTRRGAGGTERVGVDGLIAAAFPHRTSRAGDPLLHTHVLVANLARTSDDGVWRTLESRRLYLHAKTAGYLYQAQLRHELTTRLGVAWGEVVNGHADIDGIDRDLIDTFSQRRQAILKRLSERGESSARAAQVATLETREAKQMQPSEVELRQQWKAQARRAGFDEDAVARVVGDRRPQPPDVGALADELVRKEAMTERASTFARRDLLQAVAERLPDGAPVENIEQLASEVVLGGGAQLVALGPRRGHLSAVDSIRTADGRIVPAGGGEGRMTTRGLLAAEQAAIRSATERLHVQAGVVDPDTVARVLSARPTMTGEQAAMLRRLTGDGHGVAVVVGRAGTGKTFTLDAARDAWTRAGIPVRGVALAARAARELQDTSGIPSTTIHRLLTRIEDPAPGSPLERGSVLVVDEAGMVGSRQLSALIRHAHDRRVKVVLVGDPRQLPEIDAGGLYAHLTRTLDPITLVDNRRQTHAWEADALARLRHGDPAQALHLYEEHGRVVTADTAEALRERLVSDWWHARHTVGADQAVMIALRRSDVDDLNARARTRLQAAGLLHGRALDAHEVEFQAGDRILCLRNDRRIGVVNGAFATIEHVEHGALHVIDDRGRRLRLPSRYLDAGHVTHGYAITGHKAQGATVDHAFVLGSDALYREWGYVALSRGRHTNRLYVHAATVDPHGITHGPQPEPDPHTQTLAGLRRSAAQTPAVAHLHPDDVIDPNEQWQLPIDRRGLARQLDYHHQRHTELLERERELADRIQRAQAALDRLQTRRQELGGLGRLRRSTREEIADIDRQAASHRWSLDHARRDVASVREQLASLTPDHEVARWRDQLAHIEARIQQLAHARTRAAIHQPPVYVLNSIGAPPASAPQRDVWTRAVRAVETYRLRFGIRNPDHTLGIPGDDPGQQQARRQTVQALLDALPPGHELHTEPTRQRGPRRARGRSR